MSEVKPKRVLSPEALEKLKIAREKALLIRQENAKNKSLEKELIKEEKEQHLTEVKEKLAIVKAKKPIIVVEEEEKEEEEVIIKKKKPKKKVIIVEDSDSDEDHQHQVIYVKKKKDIIPQPQIIQQKVEPLINEEPIKKIIDKENIDPYKRHYHAMFNQRVRY